MGFMKDLLLSRGKFGAAGLMVLGVYLVVEGVLKGGEGTMIMEGIALVSLGLSAFGIRAKLDK